MAKVDPSLEKLPRKFKIMILFKEIQNVEILYTLNWRLKCDTCGIGKVFSYFVHPYKKEIKKNAIGILI